ncbi:DUF1707 SHOCT-like domain-containing protein [Nocardioides caricicola]|uniref:DUF1707 domain-containing protein n=1 Tax=Nocardioides caricicola TaxID=634770 RepID=A0ABW0N3V1_9ACTN
MVGELEPDRSQMRISDADRHHVSEILREAAGEGRLELDELDERLAATYAARTYADLVPITQDLPAQRPVHAPAPQPAAALATRHESSVAIMSGSTRTGVWEVGPSYSAFCVMGGVDVDLREAVFASHQVEITANTLMGGIDIIVNAHTRVIVEGAGVMGTFEQARDKVEPQLTPDSPVVRVRGVALMGAVTVVRKGPPKGSSLMKA